MGGESTATQFIHSENEKWRTEAEMVNTYELHDNYICSEDTHNRNGQRDPFQYYLMKINPWRDEEMCM